MVCGLKWKTCNCPWFNYEAVENDRLNHMNIPQARRLQEDALRNLPRVDMVHRRAQEWFDEAFARRPVLGLDDDDNEENIRMEGGREDVLNVGNAAGHFLNQDFLRRATHRLGRNIEQANNEADHLVAEQHRHAATPDADLGRGQRLHIHLPVRVRHGAAERLVPRRTPTDYMSEATRHRRHSTMAGLTANTHAGRIGIWLDHVEDEPIDTRRFIPVR